MKSLITMDKIYFGDAMDYMKQFPDNFFELAIPDPPYFSGPEKRLFYGSKISKLKIKRIDYPVIDSWDIPKKEFFDEVIRVSKNQIIWGCNYFDYNFGPGRIIWDKVNGTSSYSDCEIAYSSFHDSVRLFRFMWNGMMQGVDRLNGNTMQGNKKLNEKKIHQTQKPVELYKWMFEKYAKKGDKILDTNMGSQSSRIAVYDLKELELEYYGCELAEIHFKNGCSRFDAHKLRCEEINKYGFAKTEINKNDLSLF